MKSIKTFAISILFLISILTSLNFNSEFSFPKNTDLSKYYPTSSFGEIVEHKYYTLSYSEKDEQAEWVVYKLTPHFLNKIKRTNNFREDPLVNTKSASLLDYKKSGYDRGHLAPAAAMSFNKISMSESFYMSNMSPQLPAFNRGIWKKLELKIRQWVINNDSLFVVTGPILNKPLGHIGINNVTIPRAYYKTIIKFNNGNINGIAFIIPNEKSYKFLNNFVTSIDSIEVVTGINFYYKIDSLTQNKIETNNKFNDW